MKTFNNYTHTLIFGVLFTLTVQVSAQDFNDSKSYIDFILVEQAKILNDNIHYISKSLHDHKARQNDDERKLIIEHLNNAINNVSAMPSFKGDATLRDAALDVFNSYKHTYEFELRKADSLEIDNQSDYSAMKVYFEAQDKAEEKLVEAGKKFLRIQKAFAKKHHLSKEVKENEGLCLFTKTAQVNNYSRDIVLAYAKVADVNKDFYSSMKKKQHESMEKNRTALLATADETIALLNQLTHFEGDRTYLDKALKMTNFLKNMATQEYVELINISKNKNSTFEDSNKFMKIVVNHQKQAKSLLNEFTSAGTNLMKKTVFHESNELTAKQMNSDINKAVAQTTTKIIQEKPVITTAETRVIPNTPQD